MTTATTGQGGTKHQDQPSPMEPLYATRDDGVAVHERTVLGLIEWDLNLSVCKWTSQAEQTFGWKAEEVLGKRWDEFLFVHEDDIDQVIRTGKILIEGKIDFYTCRNRNYRKDGTVLHCEWFNSVRRDDQGKTISWVSLAHDITDRVRAEEQVRQARNAMRMIIGGTSRSTGIDFFEALVHYIAESFGFRYALIAQTDLQCRTKARTVAFWADGKLASPIVYDFAGTPCESVFSKATCFYHDHVQQHFPSDRSLVDFDARSYLGVPLIGTSGEVLGVLAVIDDKPMADRADIREILELFADRTAVEIERSINEIARHASETRLRILTEQMPAVLWTTDQQLRLTYATGTALRRLNLEPGQLIGQTLYEFFQTRDPEFRPINIHLDALQGASGSSEIHWANHTFQLYVEPLRDAERRVIGAIAVAQDISEIKLVEQSLVASETRFRRLVEHAPEAVVLLDVATGRFVMVNETAEKLYGRSVAELRLLGPLDLSPAVQPDGRSSAEFARDVIARACAGETPQFDWMHLDARGREIPCEVRLLSLQEFGGIVIRGSVIDVSSKRRAEETRKRLEADLAHVGRVSMLGELVGGLAHELNQPLYAIQNFGKACGNLIADGRDFDREQLQDWLDKITSTAQAAGSILLRLREFVSKEPIKKSVVQLEDVIETSLQLVRHDSQRAGILIEYHRGDALPQVTVDAVQIQQVLVNLLRNAFDATKQQSSGDPTVKISVEQQEDRLFVSVSDNGPGLPSGTTPIFDAFYSTKSNGLGLGLAIAKTIVEAHDGTLVAINGSPCGALFRFSLRIRTPLI